MPSFFGDGSEKGHRESGIARTKLSFTRSSLSKLIVLFQHLPQDIGRLLNDLDITVLIHGIKALQNRCQKPFTSVGTETQPDQCPGAGNDITKLPFQLGMRVEGRNCPFIEKGACIGKLHLATVPLKKRDSGFFF